MIEEALRKRIQPIVKRRLSLHLAIRLAIYWLAAAVVGLALIGANRLWGWAPPAAVIALCVATVLPSLVTWYRTRRMQPYYKAAARNIEQQHPEARALVLAAIEQEPEGPDGQLGYLQEAVIGEALKHGAKHDWLAGVAPRKLMLVRCGQIVSLLLLLAVYGLALRRIWARWIGLALGIAGAVFGLTDGGLSLLLLLPPSALLLLCLLGGSMARRYELQPSPRSPWERWESVRSAALLPRARHARHAAFRPRQRKTGCRSLQTAAGFCLRNSRLKSTQRPVSK